MSVEKTRPQSFWLLSAGPYLTPLCYQESRTEALTVQFLLCSLCFLGPQTGHSIGLALLWLHMDRVDPPCKNINTFLSNLEQIGFSYLLMGFMVPQASQSCVPSRVMEATDNAWFMSMVWLKQSAKTHSPCNDPATVKQSVSKTERKWLWDLLCIYYIFFYKWKTSQGLIFVALDTSCVLCLHPQVVDPLNFSCYSFFFSWKLILWID